MTLGKLGTMYFGETPSAMNEFNVGVIPRRRKSARKPSREIRMVVGANSADPFDRIDTVGLAPEVRETLNAPKTRTQKSMAMVAKIEVCSSIFFC